MNNQALWTRNFILASAVNFQLVLVFYMLVVVIAGFAVHELGASKAQAGLISGVFIVGTLIGRLIIGRAIQLFGRRRMLWTGLIGFILTSALYFVQVNTEFLLFVRFLHGFTLGLASTVIGTLVAQILPVLRRGEGIGYYSLSSTLGTAIGPFVGIFLVLHASYEWIFSLSLLIAISCFITSLFIKIPALPEKDFSQLQTVHKPSFWAQLIEPKALPIAVVVFICSVCYSSVLSFINFYAQQLDLEKAASLFFLIYALAILASRPFTGKLMDKKGENIVMYPALMILAVSLILLATTDQAMMLLICAGLLGFGFGNIQSITQAIAVKSTTIERMGLATSTFFIALDAGLGFGPFILGFLLNHISYAQMYLYSGIIAFIAMLLYFLLHGRDVKTVIKTI